jgi:tetrahedral aminopeptidase
MDSSSGSTLREGDLPAAEKFANMENERKEYLKELVETHGTPGYEERVQVVFRKRIEAACEKLTTDVMGSVTGVVNPDGAVRVMLDGHSDEIGFLVNYIDDNGYLWFKTSGGWDTEVVVSQRVLVHTAEGSLSGVIGKKAIHLMNADDRKKKSEIENLWVDIGAHDKEQAQKHVKVGDPITMDAPFRELLGGRAVAKSFDNRIGLFAVSETLRNLGEELEAAVYGVSAVQEEIGLRGARTAAYTIEPHVGIAIDVTHATDYPDISKKKHGDVTLGGGPVIARGPNINSKVYRRLIELAEKEGIPYQLEAEGRGTPTDANPIQLTRGGVATGLVSLPLRYMHNPCEMLHLDDLDHLVELLVAFCRSVKASDDWTPSL